MARQNINWGEKDINICAVTGDGVTAESIELSKTKFLLYYLSLDASVNVFSTAKQEWFFAASRLLANQAPEVYNDQRSYENSVFDIENDRLHLENGLKFFCPENFEYTTKNKQVGYHRT